MNNITFTILACASVGAIILKHHLQEKPDNHILYPERFREDARDFITMRLPKEGIER